MRVIQRDLRVADIGSGEKVVYFRDITRETEVDRMKSEFLSTAAHELRTPLASIFGFSELMLTRNYDEGRVKQMVGTIHRQAGLLVKLINELLDLARIEARAGKDFNYRVQPLAPVIENVVAALLVGNETRHVAVSLPSQPPLVKIDADKFSLSLTNVLANAYKYSPKGGAIELDVIAAEADGEPRIGVRVRDHGIGMSAEEVARVFERFYRADPSGNIPGTGLGMCLVKEIIELHGGQVEVASEKNVGTTVTLWLPAANASELEMAA
jgi:signal transduction histidine kinase